MSPEALIQSLLGNRRATEYVFSLPPGEFEEHLKEMDIPTFLASDEDPEKYRLAGKGYIPVIYLEYGVAFTSRVPQTDVLFCLSFIRMNPIPPPRMVIAFLHQKQSRMFTLAMRFMCLTREQQVKRTAPKRARAIYDCHKDERWVEVYLSKKPIPAEEQRMTMTA